MGNFKRIDTSIEGLCIIEPKVYGDNRGYFMETYSKPEFEEIGLNYVFVQDNQSKSKNCKINFTKTRKTRIFNITCRR